MLRIIHPKPSGTAGNPTVADKLARLRDWVALVACDLSVAKLDAREADAVLAEVEASHAALTAAVRELLRDSAADQHGAVFAPGPAAVKLAFAALDGTAPPGPDVRARMLSAALSDALSLLAELCDSVEVEADGEDVESARAFASRVAERIGRHRETLIACGEG